ncbi:MAG: putative lipid II flippase FtsW [Candidatus Saganbacteria bacterium]|nr:putative lipid II flippase FtsW [Candidatus Saganbacteria bacterium]
MLIIILALVSIGTIMVFSASPTMGMKMGDSLFYLKKHIFHLFIGFIAMAAALKINHREFPRFAIPCALFGIILLLLVFVPGIGREAGGAIRWLDLGPISFQPSEVMKLLIIILAASILSQDNKKLSDILILFLTISVSAFLIIKEPDLGTAIMLIAVSFLMFFISGLNPRFLFTSFILFIAAILIGILASPYRIRRIIAFLDPWKYREDIGFHIIQSLLAVGSGGIFGLGLGASKQKFFYLPSQYTDFIYAILCEELGFIGGVGVIILFILFAIRGMRAARFAEGKFGQFLAAGITSWIALQGLINISVVLGLIPTTGIPLPFISFGGTSTVLTLFSVGILLNISRSEGNLKKA